MRNMTKHDVGTLPTLMYPITLMPLASQSAETLPALMIAETMQSLQSKLPASTLPPKLPVQLPMEKPRNHRHTLYIIACQVIYANIALSLAFLAYRYLAAYPVYRVVAFVVIGILWSNLASSAMRRKSVKGLATVKMQAIRVKGQVSHMSSPALIDSTNVFLQAVKKSILDK